MQLEIEAIRQSFAESSERYMEAARMVINYFQGGDARRDMYGYGNNMLQLPSHELDPCLIYGAQGLSAPVEDQPSTSGPFQLPTSGLYQQLTQGPYQHLTQGPYQLPTSGLYQQRPSTHQGSYQPSTQGPYQLPTSGLYQQRPSTHQGSYQPSTRGLQDALAKLKNLRDTSKNNEIFEASALPYI